MAEQAKRIYLISHKDSGDRHLVRAVSESAARRHVSRDLYEARVASQEDLVKHRDVPVEDA